jgi:hypothetical protein
MTGGVENSVPLHAHVPRTSGRCYDLPFEAVLQEYLQFPYESRFVSKTVLRNKYLRCFYFYSLTRHVSAYLMAILRRIVQNIKRRCYLYNGSILCV